MRTLSDDYADEPTEAEDSERVPDPKPVGFFGRALDWLARRAAGQHLR
jgi:hypothetical protein